MLDGWEILGLIAGALTAFATLPQSIRILRTGDTAAVSALTLALLVASYALWLAYGLGRASLSITFWNVIALALAGLTLYLKLQGEPKK